MANAGSEYDIQGSQVSVPYFPEPIKGNPARDGRLSEGGSRWASTAGGSLKTWMATRPENSGAVVRLTTWTAAQE